LIGDPQEAVVDDPMSPVWNTIGVDRLAGRLGLP